MRLSVAVIAVLTLLSTLPLAAAGTDSNVSSEDPRLDQKITYRCEAKRLDAVLPDIARQTGVVIGVDPSKRFWSVRQRKVTLFIKDMPLRQFMDELETLLDYHFTRQGKPEEYTYTLWQDARGNKREQAILGAQEEAKRLHRVRAIEETLRDAELALTMEPEDVKAIEGSNPWLAYLAGNPRGRAYAQLLQAIPREHFSNLVEGSYYGSIRLRLDELPVRGQEALQQIWSLIDLKKVEEDYKSISLRPSQIEGIQMHGSWDDDNDPAPPAPFWLYVTAEDPDATSSGGVTADAFMIGRSDIPMSEPRSVPTLRNEEELSARAGLSDLLRAAEREVRKPDPDLEMIADYSGKDPEPNQGSLAYELGLLADMFHINVMHEHYPERNSGYSTGGGERRLAEILDDITSRYRLDWDKAGKVIRFRHCDWAERRSWEIPPDWIAYWLKLIESNSGLSMDDLADIASRVTDAQIEHGFSTGNPNVSSSIDEPALVRVFGAAGIHNVRMSRQFLELYGRLRPEQKTMIWSEDGLSFEEIADDPIFEQSPPTIGEAPMYDVAIRLLRKHDPNTKADQTFVSMKFRVWLKDLSEKQVEQLRSHVSAEELAKGDSEPVEIVQGGDTPIFPVDTERVKQALQELREARERAAAKKAEDP